MQVVQDLSKERKKNERNILFGDSFNNRIIDIAPNTTGATFCLTNYRNFMLQMGREIRKFHILQKRKSDKMKSDRHTEHSDKHFRWVNFRFSNYYL